MFEDKQAISDGMLSEGSVMVAVDATRDGVIVPPEYKGRTALMLRLGYDLKPAIDLELGEHDMAMTLSFKGVEHKCVLPWSAIYAVKSEVTGVEVAWHADAPGVVTFDLEEEPKPKSAGHLKLVN